MDIQILIRDRTADSHVIGAILLILIAVCVSGLIYSYVLPVPLPATEPNVKIMGYVMEDGTLVLEHMGGESLSSYEIYADGELIYENDDSWEIGEREYPTTGQLIDQNDEILITVYQINNEGYKQQVFSGKLRGIENSGSSIPIMLVSSLRTDTTDEDLICYNYSIVPDVDASTYIYNWKVNGNSINEILMPFNSENSAITKDYSGNGYDGSVNGATWTDLGIVGGAYYFSGSSDYITLPIPSTLNDVTNNDFTISVWMKSNDITDDQRVLLEGGRQKNFALLFQFGTEIHFGVCDDGVQHAVRTENLTSNTWYHIAGVWDADYKSLSVYCNGVVSIEPGNRTYAQGVQDGFDVGHGTASSRFWYGYIDELQLFDRALSGDQIYQIYLCSKKGFSDKSVIVSDETVLSEEWRCIVTPNDGTQDGTPVESNNLEIISYGGGG